ncbi:hypothetical protein [Pelomonas cellulosilytica]|uniref:Uncharacterized protein n=1 Tax=Pelomonas cellulosilytica TaxID=2906762 RepID=A0ABS8XWZ5_9BURK|nr:hypothetical protein [Pelomonas sp. P8]MCE4557186.1 hypothetical protein [Pelomonas sp. P8]
MAVAVATAALYGVLALIKPAGEGWGRGWNLIGFWLYGSPAALLLAVLAFWRAARLVATPRRLARLIAALALIFPVVAAVVIRLKA